MRKNKDLHKLLKDNIVSGPSVIFHRFNEKEVTNIRQHEYGERSHLCKTIVGYDANALYPWALTRGGTLVDAKRIRTVWNTLIDTDVWLWNGCRGKQHEPVILFDTRQTPR